MDKRLEDCEVGDIIIFINRYDPSLWGIHKITKLKDPNEENIHAYSDILYSTNHGIVSGVVYRCNSFYKFLPKCSFWEVFMDSKK